MNPQFIAVIFLSTLQVYMSSATSELSWNVSTDVCTGDTAYLRAESTKPCDNARLTITTPQVEVSPRNLTKTEYGFLLHNVQLKDQGIYTVRKYCAGPVYTSKTLLQVTCEARSAVEGNEVKLAYPPQLNIYQAQYQQLESIEVSLLNNQSFKAVLNENVTDKGIEEFEHRLKMSANRHEIILANISKNDAGNYTCIRSWIKGEIRIPSTFTFILRVQGSPTIQPNTPRPYDGANATGQSPTIGSSASAGNAHSPRGSLNRCGRITESMSFLVGIGVLVAFIAIYAT